MSLQGNTYQVDPLLVGHRVELVFDPFDLTTIAVRVRGIPAGTAIPHRVGRHSHVKARPETPPDPPAPTGIDYARLSRPPFPLLRPIPWPRRSRHVRLHLSPEQRMPARPGPRATPDPA
ncbi:Mu transposase C-terminal domain-containing protein [Pseudonocardia nigra]|uniref:Mu transposase C-terminal domain-containing protein n=1 Tax=Pseudonocardia nigra TaxID=1921578 RepID=UPI001C5D837F